MIVMSKATNRRGFVSPAAPTEYQVYFGKKVGGGYSSIEIHKADKNGVIQKCRSFKLGDEAEHGSYNLVYTGIVTKITEKAVTILEYAGSSMERTHRLHLNEFCWRNYDFDAVKTSARNADTMMYI